MKTLHKKKALITGGSKGLGKAVAVQLAKDGIDTVIVSRNVEDLRNLQKEIQHIGTTCQIFSADLSDPGQVKQLVADMQKENLSFDIIVHNAGGSLKVTDSFADAEVYQNVWYFNVGAGIEINNAYIDSMVSSGWGRIIHITSASTSTYKGYSPYVSAKCALVGYVKSLSRKVADRGVIISAVSPGPIKMPGRYLTIQEENATAEWDTYCKEQLSIGRLATPEEIATAVMYLCSDNATYTAGTIINIDGGTL